jgi:hypothetical protein
MRRLVEKSSAYLSSVHSTTLSGQNEQRLDDDYHRLNLPPRAVKIEIVSSARSRCQDARNTHLSTAGPRHLFTSTVTSIPRSPCHSSNRHARTRGAFDRRERAVYQVRSSECSCV